MLLGMFVITTNDAYADPKTPEKFAPDQLLIKFKKDVLSIQGANLIMQNNDVTVLEEIHQIDVKVLKVPEDALDKVLLALSNNPNVESVEKNWIYEPALIPNDQYFQNQWHLTKIEADKGWDITQGSASPIAILDTGIDSNHPDLAGKLQSGYNFYDNNNDLTDVCGHGTKVAGTAAAISNNVNGVAGVAWNNPIIPIKITAPNCYGYYSAMLKGIVHAADNGARVANISFQIYGGDYLTDAAKYMHDKGGWVVVAGGNSGRYEDYDSTGDNPYLISVAATDSNDVRTSWSSYGKYIDFAAPGSGIYTTFTDNRYGSTSGTSFSSPIVAGVVALLFSADPTLSSGQVYDILKSTAVDLGTSGRDDYYGWGRINAYAALSSIALPVDTEPPSVSITNPIDGQEVSGTFTLSADSSDNVAVSNVNLYVDNSFYAQKLSEPYDFLVDAGTMTEGTHVFKAFSYDTSDNSAFSQINLNVIPEIVTDTTPPTVSIINPSNSETVSDVFAVIVASTDNVSVDHVELIIDGIMHDEKSISPFEFNVDSSQLTDGDHTIEAMSIDTSDNSASTQISITISNESEPINDPPFADNDSGEVDIGGMITINLAEGDTDADDGLNLSSILITLAPLHGQLTDLADGKIKYTHDGSDTTSDSFEYTIDDNSGETSNVATVSITIIEPSDSVEDGFAISDDNFSTETRTFDLAEDFTMYLKITSDEDVHSSLVHSGHIKKAECEVKIGKVKISKKACKLTEVSPGTFVKSLDKKTIEKKFPKGGTALVKLKIEDIHKNKLQFKNIEVHVLKVDSSAGNSDSGKSSKGNSDSGKSSKGNSDSGKSSKGNSGSSSDKGKSNNSKSDKGNSGNGKSKK